MTKKKELGFKEVIGLKDRFAKDRHKEKMEYSDKRFHQALKILSKKDEFADKRHKERVSYLAGKTVK